MSLIHDFVSLVYEVAFYVTGGILGIALGLFAVYVILSTTHLIAVAFGRAFRRVIKSRDN